MSSMMADIEGDRMSVRSCSNLTEDFLAALFCVWRHPNTFGMEAWGCSIE